MRIQVSLQGTPFISFGYFHFLWILVSNIQNEYTGIVGFLDHMVVAVVQSLSHVQRFVNPWTVACQASLSPGVCSNSCPLSWCQPTVSSSVAPFSSCLQSILASGSFPMSWLFTSSGQSIGVSASASVSPMNIQGCMSFRIDWFDFLSVQGTLKSLLQCHSFIW